MIGIIGFGKLGSAFAQGFLNAGVKVFAYDSSEQKIILEGIQKASSSKEVFEKSEMVFLGLKPDTLVSVLKECPTEKLLISPAAKLTLAEMQEASPNSKLIRVMPNIAAAQNLSPIPYSLGKSVSTGEETSFIELFSRVGVTVKVEESQMDIIAAIAGSSPAYFAYFARAMREAAKEQGVPEETANLLLAQVLSGTGALLSKSSCEEIMDRVTTKGGVTEKGIKEL
ncbi:MAG: NAD(P)-binding domain-containing protein, partial [bacterium]|nr:NAD(P)-binding domain-containing protein [bacterium]